MFESFRIPISWSELGKRTVNAINRDDVIGLSAQLAFYFFLALFPAMLFLIALASYFPLEGVTQQLVGGLRGFLPEEALALLDQQLQNISEGQHGGILTIGILGALWSSSAALVAVIAALNRAYGIEESRPWWRVRLTAIGLTVALAFFILVSFGLVVAGPALAESLAAEFGLGAAFEWTWKILQWPVVFLLVSIAIGLTYYAAPDAEQTWTWITPGSLFATLTWLLATLGFRFYIVNFGEYNEMYGAVAGVIMLMLWFYISAFAVLIGAELSAEIEHASPHAKDPGERAPGEKKKIGVAAARAYRERGLAPAPARQPAAVSVEGRGASAARPADVRGFETVVAVPLLLMALWSRWWHRVRG